MLAWLVTFFTTLADNPIATGILASTLVGGLLYVCRELPKKAWFFFWDSVTTNLYFVEENETMAFYIFEEEVKRSKVYPVAASHLVIFNSFRKEVEFMPGNIGLFFGKIAGKWCLFRKYTDDQVKFWHSFCYTARFFTRDRKFLDDYFNKAYIEQKTKSRGDNVLVFQYVENKWRYIKKPKLSLNTEALPKVKQQIVDTVGYFLKNKQEYLKREKPYREGFILSGEPGTGKSHFILQIASHFSLNIYYVNLMSFLNDSTFIKAMMEIPLPSIILFEDIDACEITHDRAKRKNYDPETVKNTLSNKSKAERDDGVTLSTLLNFLDGLLSAEGALVFLTTNYLEKLDSALIRAGRFNTNVTFEKLTGPEICCFISKIYDTKVDWDLGDLRMSIAELAAMCNNKSLEDLEEILRRA